MTATLDGLSPTVRQVVARAADPSSYERWAEQVAATGYCARPVRLAGRVDAVDRDTGEVRQAYCTDAEPDATLLKACGNRRQSVCPSCAATYRSDAWQLIAAGLRGGKGVPETVAGHPAVFATFTAPSFGPVHSRRARNGRTLTCRPKDPRTCPHGRPKGCRRRHDPDDPTLGQPLCAECYDPDGAVLWNAVAPELWRRTTIYMRRALARLCGVSRAQLERTVRVSYVKVAEYQRRGLVHFHAVVRLDAAPPKGEPQRVDPPPAAFTVGLLEDAVRLAAATVSAPIPATGDGRTRVARWGQQLDIRHIHDAGVDALTPEVVAAYIAKYATKSTEPLGLVPTDLPDDPDTVDAPDHIRELIAACARLGRLPQLAHLGLVEHAGLLGFRGHWSTKSRRYSTTLGALLAARRDYAVRRRHGQPLDPWGRPVTEETVVVLPRWRFTGIGHRTPGDAWLAQSAAASAREQRQAARLELAVAA
ncbi:MAG: replication initiation protein [Actinomycetota bacterium]|nr:replication initiation protein [Actinomycetota bacterium]